MLIKDNAGNSMSRVRYDDIMGPFCAGTMARQHTVKCRRILAGAVLFSVRGRLPARSTFRVAAIDRDAKIARFFAARHWCGDLNGLDRSTCLVAPVRLRNQGS